MRGNFNHLRADTHRTEGWKRAVWALLPLLLSLCAGLLAGGNAWAKGVGVTDVRSWSAPERTRVVLDLTGSSDYRIARFADPPEIVVDVDGGVPKSQQTEWKAVDRRVKSVTMDRTETGARITIRLARASQYKHFSLSPYGEKPHRIVVDVLDAPAPKAPEPRENKPAPAPAATPAAIATRPLVVMIDPGHGGEDSGALGRYFRSREKDIVLAIGKYLKAELDAMPGIRAYMTRSGDYFISLGGRVRKADTVHADLFVSIHADSSRDRRTRGTHVYTLAPRTARDKKAMRLARVENASDMVGGVEAASRLPVVYDANGHPNNMVESGVLAQLSMGRLQEVNRNGRHGRRSEARFWVLKGERPSILVETGFLSNKTDEKSLREPEFQRHLARQLAQAVADYNQARINSSTFAYTVRRGDSLSKLAERYKVSVGALAQANHISQRAGLQVGERLLIPRRGVGPKAPVASAPQVTRASVRTTPAPPAPSRNEAVITRTHHVKRGDTLTGIAREYGVRLADLARVNGLTTRSRLRVGQRLSVPARRAGDIVHVVRRGETLSGLAQFYGVPVKRLAGVNDLRPRTQIRIGWEIIVPGVGEKRARVHVVRSGETLSGLAQRFGVSLTSLARANGLSTRARLLKGQKLTIPGASRTGPVVHVIRRGESLSRIAKLYHVPLDRLRKTNGIRNADHLLVGERLLIPD